VKNNKKTIKQNFSASALTYELDPGLHQTIINQVLNLLTGDYHNILDVGCGTGVLLEELTRRYPKAECVGLDLSEGMVKQAQNKIKQKQVKFIVGDGETLPFPDQSFDLVVSTSALHWMDYKQVFAEVARVLKPGGTFCLATFGPETLKEIKEIGLEVNDFPSKNELENALKDFFASKPLAKSIIVKEYKNIYALFKYLQQIGAQTPLTSAKKGLSPKKNLPQGKIKVNFEVYLGTFKRI